VTLIKGNTPYKNKSKFIRVDVENTKNPLFLTYTRNIGSCISRSDKFYLCVRGFITITYPKGIAKQ